MLFLNGIVLGFSIILNLGVIFNKLLVLTDEKQFLKFKNLIDRILSNSWRIAFNKLIKLN